MEDKFANFEDFVNIYSKLEPKGPLPTHEPQILWLKKGTGMKISDDQFDELEKIVRERRKEITSTLVDLNLLVGDNLINKAVEQAAVLSQALTELALIYQLQDGDL